MSQQLDMQYIVFLLVLKFSNTCIVTSAALKYGNSFSKSEIKR